MFILDLGSGNTCKNKIDTALSMVRSVVDLKIPNVIIKWQLFQKAGNNMPLDWEVFERVHRYAMIYNIPTTASVFDKTSLDYLLKFTIPFVKIANCKESQDMLKYIPEYIKVILSADKEFKTERKNIDIIYTVSKYPAEEKEYEKYGDKLKQGMSDHTTNWNLFKKYQPKIYECHFCLEDSEGLDAGAFARRPKDFTEILNLNESNLDMLLKDELAKVKK
jgi:sialic acid synthase SpsE